MRRNFIFFFIMETSKTRAQNGPPFHQYCVKPKPSWVTVNSSPLSSRTQILKSGGRQSIHNITLPQPSAPVKKELDLMISSRLIRKTNKTSKYNYFTWIQILHLTSCTILHYWLILAKCYEHYFNILFSNSKYKIYRHQQSNIFCSQKTRFDPYPTSTFLIHVGMYNPSQNDGSLQAWKLASLIM